MQISDYALIGDCETAALVGKNGSIDWLCWPRFDSDACFTAILGNPEHGRWRIAPLGEGMAKSRRYRDDTLILETDFETEDGAVTLIDFMPTREEGKVSDLCRIVVGKRGRVKMRMEMKLRFDYGRIVPWVSNGPEFDGLRIIAGPHAAYLKTGVPTQHENQETVAEFTVAEGECVAFVLGYEASHLPPPQLCEADDALSMTEKYWTDWSARCEYDGPWRDAVIRSLITVKALTYRPTGGIIAAPTSSLPEKIGGGRNWDYRYSWLRDATFTLLSLINAGYREEAEAWCDWLLRAVAGDPAQIQPLYGVGGEHRADEIILDWLPGYHDSRPVRIGNAAYLQLQIDVFGSVLDTLFEAQTFDLSLNEASATLQQGLLAHLEQVWREPDEGLWEVRSGRQHFVHAKLMSWVAFDRGIASAEQFGLQGPVRRWRRIRDEIHAEICERGYDREKGAFVQAYGSKALDASVLLMPIYGFLPPDDPRIVSTVKAIEAELMRGGLLLRYDATEAPDGMDGDEGAFLACSFWLADNMILQDRMDEAEKLFEHLLSLRNDVGLLSEQYDWVGKTLVGNFPQAFSHFALIDTAFNFASAQGALREAQT